MEAFPGLHVELQCSSDEINTKDVLSDSHSEVPGPNSLRNFFNRKRVQ